MSILFPKLPKYDDSYQREADAKLAQEQARKDKYQKVAIKRRQGGYAGTILTSGRGLEEDAPMVQTMLGGASNTDII